MRAACPFAPEYVCRELRLFSLVVWRDSLASSRCAATGDWAVGTATGFGFSCRHANPHAAVIRIDN